MNRFTTTLITTLCCISAQGQNVADPPSIASQVASPEGSSDYVMTELPLQSVAAINDSGVAVGVVYNDSDNPSESAAAAVVDGQVIILKGKTRGYSSLFATNVSNAGHIVGHGRRFGSASMRALFWPTATAEPIDMGGFDGSNTPTAVNSQGIAVGVHESGGISHAFRWTQETGMTLIDPPAVTYAYPRDISETGYITGAVSFGGNLREIARWYPSGTYGIVARSGAGWQMLDNGGIVGFGPVGQEHVPALFSVSNTPTALTSAFKAIRMTSTGRLVGSTAPSGGFAMTQESLHAPATQLPNPSGGFTYAIDANNCGTIVGWAMPAIGNSVAVMWRRPACDPHPSTTVPEVRGYSLDQGALVLRQSSLFAGTSTYVPGYCSDVGRIVAQTPGSATQVPQASFVDVTIVGNCAVVVPGLRGQTVDEAAATLHAAGLTLGQKKYAIDTSCNNIGRVMSQSPAQGTPSTWRSPVSVTIGQRPRTACP